MTAGNQWDQLPERFALNSAYHEVAAVIGYDAAVAFGLAVWNEKRAPSRAGKIYERGEIYIPTRIGGWIGSELVRLAGPENAAKLVEKMGGSALTFTNIVKTSIKRRNLAIARAVSTGDRVAVVAAAFGLSERQIRRIAQNGAESVNQ